MTLRAAVFSALLAPSAFAQAARPAPPPIPARPELLVFKPLAFDPPKAQDHRAVLKNGMVVFIDEDRSLPLVTVSITFRAGSYLDPEGKEGLSSLAGSLMRRGGTSRLSAEALDERLDFLATQIGTSISETAGSAFLNCLRDNLDESLSLLSEILKEPRFQEDRLTLAKEQALQDMKKRNDDAARIEGREFSVLLYGEANFQNRFQTGSSVESITRGDLVAFHKRIVHPSQMVAAVSGSFDRSEMLQKLEKAFEGWPNGAPNLPPVPETYASASPGLYRVQKDVNQGRVSVGLLSVRRTSPDVYALEVMNEILGGAGFSSRITQSVRSNEGLAYQAGSRLSFGVWAPGEFRALFQSKSASVAYALKLVLDEIRRIRESEVSAEELDTIKRNLVETFPTNFSSKAQAMGVFASDEYTHREPGYWTTYRDRIRAVTAQDVLKVAQEYLVPEKMIVLVVGDQTAIDRGDSKHAFTLESLVGGKATTLPLRDPLTMRRP